MGCSSCRGGVKRVRVSAVSAGRPGQGGVYSLAGYPDCTSAHAGAHAATSVIVVGRGSKDEKLFNRSDLANASAYAKEVRLNLENLPTTGLCDQAVVDLLG